MHSSGRTETQTSSYPDRRQRLRFDMSLPVLLHTLGDPWRPGISTNISVDGMFVLTEGPLLLNTDVECVLSLPPKLTKAKQPLILLCYGTVLRCEHVDKGDLSFGIALQSRDCRYLPKDKSARFDAMFEEISATATKLESQPNLHSRTNET